MDQFGNEVLLNKKKKMKLLFFFGTCIKNTSFFWIPMGFLWWFRSCWVTNILDNCSSFVFKKKIFFLKKWIRYSFDSINPVTRPFFSALIKAWKFVENWVDNWVSCLKILSFQLFKILTFLKCEWNVDETLSWKIVEKNF